MKKQNSKVREIDLPGTNMETTRGRFSDRSQSASTIRSRRTHERGTALLTP